MQRVISSNQAVSLAVKSAGVKVIAAYPITPQSSIVENLAFFCSEGSLQAKFINVESEHSAMAACIAASAVGARTFTATSSQGLALMHEMLHYASGMRLPIVMANINRAIAAPFNIKADLSDSLSQRDTGWIQFYCASGQEVFDTIIQAYRLSEKILLPVMVNAEGFILSHTYEVVDIPEAETIQQYLPEPPQWHSLSVENPFMLGAPTDLYMHFRYRLHQAMEEAKAVIDETAEEFRRHFGRQYMPVHAYNCEDAELILVTAGTIAGTASEISDRYRLQGRNLGVARIRLFRPFPAKQLGEVVKGARKILVVERDYSPSVGGILAQEIKAVLKRIKPSLPVYESIAGLGGKDVTDRDIETAVEWAQRTEETADCLWLGLDK